MFEFKHLNLSDDIDMMVGGRGDEEILDLFDVGF
jgi:hypothetical protein